MMMITFWNADVSIHVHVDINTRLHGLPSLQESLSVHTVMRMAGFTLVAYLHIRSSMHAILHISCSPITLGVMNRAICLFLRKRQTAFSVLPDHTRRQRSCRSRSNKWKPRNLTSLKPSQTKVNKLSVCSKEGLAQLSHFGKDTLPLALGIRI